MKQALNEKASAKINLYLHVTGKRKDGYHLLDSLIIFAQDACDELTLTPSNEYELKIEGDYAPLLLHDSVNKNLITKALKQAAQNLSKSLNFNILLRKILPLRRFVWRPNIGTFLRMM
jgi:4-diphosphocytidyl-2-C-methyl-D-erythritol kinase